MQNLYSEIFVYSNEVELALKEGKAIVALESTIIVCYIYLIDTQFSILYFNDRKIKKN